MRTIFSIAYYTIIRNFRDIKSMANMILMPIILILILGNALSGVFNATKIGRTAVAYIDNDKGEISRSFIGFTESNEIKEMVKIVEVADYSEGIDLLKDKKVFAVIVMEEGLSESIRNGGTAEIKVYVDTNNKLRSSVVNNLLESFTGASNAMIAKMMIWRTDAADYGFRHRDVMEEVPLSSAGKVPDAMDYYAVTMLVLISLYGSLYALHGIGEDYLGSMGNRLRSTPVRLSNHFAGKVLGNILTIYIQLVVLIVFTKYVYGANWGGNPLEILFISFTLSVFSVSFGLMMVMLVKERKIANALVQSLIPVITFISGGYARFQIDNNLYNAVKFLMPSNLAQTAFFNSIYGEFAGQTVSSVFILWIITAALFAVALAAGRRRLA